MAPLILAFSPLGRRKWKSVQKPQKKAAATLFKGGSPQSGRELDEELHWYNAYAAFGVSGCALKFATARRATSWASSVMSPRTTPMSTS